MIERVEDLKSAKKKYDLAVRNVFAEIDDDQPRLPFDAAAGETQSEEKATLESLRETLIDELDVADGIKTKLREAGLKTIGQIGTFTVGEHWLTDIKGIGVRKADLLMEALEKFWNAHPTPDDGDTDEDEEEND